MRDEIGDSGLPFYSHPVHIKFVKQVSELFGIPLHFSKPYTCEQWCNYLEFAN